MKAKASEAMQKLRNYKTHPLISSKPIISLKLLGLLDETFFGGGMGQFSPFNTIISYVSRIERLSQKSTALQSIKDDLKMRNPEVGQLKFKKNINEIIRCLRESLR